MTRMVIEYNGKTYTGKDVEGQDAEKTRKQIEEFLPEANRLSLELHDGSFLVIGKDAVQLAVILLVP